jgi:two-component system sensor histidine kinase/response regulator
VGTPSLLLGDPLRLGQVLLNLCGNAVKFTERGEVELAFRCIESAQDAAAERLTLQIYVRDSGVGMTPEVQQRLFEKFSQADQSTTRRFGGTGLGLAISKNLIELMGGRIWVEDSQPGKGTTIALSIPLKCAKTADQRQLLEQVGPLLQGIRVLVVDDNPVSRDILAEILRFIHLEVVVAADGASALQAVLDTQDKPFDLVLMDWRMPGMNGDEVVRRIHHHAAIVHKPKIVMITAWGREDVIRLAEEAGVDAFLIKPVSPSTLLDTLLSVLGRGRILGDEDQSQRRMPAQNAGTSLVGARMLLVEDNDISREFARELLGSVGIDVDEAVHGEQAVAMVQANHYDAVLMDIQMPVLGGLQATERIRALAQQTGEVRFAQLPIIAMTALAMAQDVEKSRAAGMNDHVTKPIVPERLMAVLEHWVHPTSTGEPPLPASPTSPVAMELPAELLALKSLEAREGIRRIGGKIDAWRRQLQRFREHYAQAFSHLQHLIVEQDLRAAREYCHALKGVSGNIGARPLFEQIGTIDAQLKEGTSPDAAEMTEMQRLLQQVLEEIDSLAADVLSSPQSPQSPQAVTALDPARVFELLTQLGNAIENDLSTAEPILAALRQATLGTALAPPIAELAEKVDIFAVDEAQAQRVALQNALRATISEPGEETP